MCIMALLDLWIYYELQIILGREGLCTSTNDHCNIKELSIECVKDIQNISLKIAVLNEQLLLCGF